MTAIESDRLDSIPRTLALRCGRYCSGLFEAARLLNVTSCDRSRITDHEVVPP